MGTAPDPQLVAAAPEPTGFGRRNVHCSNCGDERGGPFGHETSECRYRPGMVVADLVMLPHLAERQGEVYDHYVDRYMSMRLAGLESPSVPSAKEPTDHA